MFRSRSIVETLKPGVGSRARLLLAGLIWSLVGAGISVAGLRWMLTARWTWWLPGTAVALLLGLAKGHLFLVPNARANAERILAAGEHRCIGGTVTWPAWGLVAIMILAGVLLRHSALPRPWLGLAYLAVGSALLRGSLVTWGYWRRARAR